MIILLSKSTLNDQYAQWLKSLGRKIQLKDAYSENNESLDEMIKHCSGIVLTGGSDINPERYGRASESDRCEKIDNIRDELEMNLIATALTHKIPLLAICRGVQIINIYFNGTLVIDIPSDYGKKVEHRNKADVYHGITIAKDSDLYRYSRYHKFKVNSSHHQAIGLLGRNLIPVAWSEDDLVEAVQLTRRLSHPFFLGVQWHPERMKLNHPMSGGIGRAFLQKAKKYSNSEEDM